MKAQVGSCCVYDKPQKFAVHTLQHSVHSVHTCLTVRPTRLFISFFFVHIQPIKWAITVTYCPPVKHSMICRVYDLRRVINLTGWNRICRGRKLKFFNSRSWEPAQTGRTGVLDCSPAQLVPNAGQEVHEQVLGRLQEGADCVHLKLFISVDNLMVNLRS